MITFVCYTHSDYKYIWPLVFGQIKSMSVFQKYYLWIRMKKQLIIFLIKLYIGLSPFKNNLLIKITYWSVKSSSWMPISTIGISILFINFIEGYFGRLSVKYKVYYKFNFKFF